MANDRISQVVAEVLSVGNPKARTSQVALDVLSVGNPTARVSQVVVDVLVANQNLARTSQITTEVLTVGNPKARSSQVVIEVLTPSDEAGDIIEDSFSDSISLSDSVSLNGDFNLSFSDTLTTLEDFSYVGVFPREISDTLTLTEILFTTTLHDDITLTDDFSNTVWKTGSFSDTLSETEDLLTQLTLVRTFPEAITLLESLTNHVQRLRDFSDTVTFTETMTGLLVKVFSDSITFSDTIESFVSKLLQDFLDLGDLLTYTAILNRACADNPALADTISYTALIRQTLSETLTLTDSAIGHVVRIFEETLTPTDTVTGVQSKPLNDTLTASDTFSVNTVLNRSMNDPLSLSDSLTQTVVLNNQFNEFLNFAEQMLGIRNRFGNFTDTLTLTDQVLRETIYRTISDTLVLGDAFTVTKIGLGELTENLALAESLSVELDLNLQITDWSLYREGFVVKVIPHGPKTIPGEGINVVPMPNLPATAYPPYNFPPGWPSLNPGDPIPPDVSQFFLPSPVYQGVLLVLPQLVIRGSTRSIVLPPPEFNDFTSNQGKIVVNRSMAGSVRVYRKTTEREKINWRFVMPKYKADELKEFIIAEINNPLDIVDWKGNLWHAQFLGDSVDFAETRRWIPCGNAVDVTLELVGTRYA
jgi:hypothetical protein